MSDLFVDNIKHQSSQGSGTITIGASGEKIDLGATAGGTFTSRPAFSARPNSNQSIPSTTFTKIEFDIEDYDTDSAFDLTNNRFVCPSGKAGKYLFIATFIISLGNDESVLSYFYKNGSRIDFSIGKEVKANDGNSAATNSIAVINLDVDDYLEMFGYQTSGVSKNTISSYISFQGHRLIGV